MSESLKPIPYAASMPEPPSQRCVRSSFAFEETLSRLREAILAEELWLIHEIDPQKLAEQGGYQLLPARQILFFHPRYLARLLAADLRALVEVPLKLIVLQMPDGTVTVRHPRPAAVFAGYAGLEPLATELEELLQRIVGGLAPSC